MFIGYFSQTGGEFNELQKLMCDVVAAVSLPATFAVLLSFEITIKSSMLTHLLGGGGGHNSPSHLRQHSYIRHAKPDHCRTLSLTAAL